MELWVIKPPEGHLEGVRVGPEGRGEPSGDSPFGSSE